MKDAKKEKPPLNPDTELLRYGPFPGRYYNVSEFEGIFSLFPKIYKGESWPKALAFFKGKRMLWINEYLELQKRGQSVFLKYMLPKSARRKVRDGWKKDLAAVKKIEKEIAKKKLNELGQEELIDLWARFTRSLYGFWSNVVIPELANYGSDKLLESELKKIIKNKTELNRAMEILTAPNKLSFYQKEEVALSKTKNLEKHFEKYFWLKNSYGEAVKLDIKFFAERKKELSGDIKKRIKERQKQAKIDKINIRKKYNLPKNIADIAEAIVSGIEWQDTRKKDILTYLYYKDLFIEEASKRLLIKKDDLLNFKASEISEMFEGKITKKEIRNRRKYFAIYFNNRGSKIAEKANDLWQIYNKQKIKRNIKIIKGIIASKGKGIARGKVKIISSPMKAGNFKKGYILVAPITSPEYIFLMRKSSAIITDEGGLTSHAAIVSRELGIPCIVGTKIATKVLKDGDLVEVDANKGIVRILKRNKKG